MIFASFSFTQLCLTTGPQRLPKPVLHTVRSIASSLSLQYTLFPEGQPVVSYVFFLIFASLISFPSIFPSVTCSSRPFLRHLWQAQLAFILFLQYAGYSLSYLIVCNTFSFLTRSAQLIFFILLQHHISKCSTYWWYTFRGVQVSTS